MPPATFTVTEIALDRHRDRARRSPSRASPSRFWCPSSLGILLSYTLRPLVSLLERIRIPRFAAAALVVAVLVVADLGHGLCDSRRRERLGRRIAGRRAQASTRGRRRGAAVAGADDQHEGRRRGARQGRRRSVGQADRRRPTRRRPACPRSSRISSTQQSGKALGVLAEILVALLLALFLLAAGDTFRRKVAKIAGASLARRRVTVEVLNEIDGQIQAYMMTLLIANVLIALVTWGALTLLGRAQRRNAGRRDGRRCTSSPMRERSSPRRRSASRRSWRPAASATRSSR